MILTQILDLNGRVEVIGILIGGGDDSAHVRRTRVFGDIVPTPLADRRPARVRRS